MSAGRGRATGLDIAVIVDATLTQPDLEQVYRLFDGFKRPARLAVVVFGDHKECAGDIPSGAGIFAVRSSGFSQDLLAQREWLRANAAQMPHPYWDAALECALAAAGDLDWREEATKRVLVVGWSLPHHSPASSLPIRTGAPCPFGQCWSTQLGRLAALPKMLIHAVCPASEGTSDSDFLGLLRRFVWNKLDCDGAPDVLGDGPDSRWAQDLARLDA